MQYMFKEVQIQKFIEGAYNKQSLCEETKTHMQDLQTKSIFEKNFTIPLERTS